MRLYPLFTDSAVLSRDREIRIFGTAEPGQRVTVSLTGAAGEPLAEEAREHNQVPVGIIGCNWGGSSVTAWMDEETLRESAEGTRYLEEYAELSRGVTLAQWREVGQPEDGSWPRLRWSQELALRQSANTGMAVMIDGGELNNIHPTDKRTVGHARRPFPGRRAWRGTAPQQGFQAHLRHVSECFCPICEKGFDKSPSVCYNSSAGAPI